MSAFFNFSIVYHCSDKNCCFRYNKSLDISLVFLIFFFAILGFIQFREAGPAIGPEDSPEASPEASDEDNSDDTSKLETEQQGFVDESTSESMLNLTLNQEINLETDTPTNTLTALVSCDEIHVFIFINFFKIHT